MGSRGGAWIVEYNNADYKLILTEQKEIRMKANVVSLGVSKEMGGKDITYYTIAFNPWIIRIQCNIPPRRLSN